MGPLSFLFSQAAAGPATGLFGKSGWRCCRHGEEAQSDSAEPVSNVMTADCTEPEPGPGPPRHFLLATCLLDLHAETKHLFSGIMSLRGAPELREV